MKHGWQDDQAAKSSNPPRTRLSYRYIAELQPDPACGLTTLLLDMAHFDADHVVDLFVGIVQGAIYGYDEALPLLGDTDVQAVIRCQQRHKIVWMVGEFPMGTSKDATPLNLHLPLFV